MAKRLSTIALSALAISILPGVARASEQPNVIEMFRDVAPFKILKRINHPSRARVVEMRQGPSRYYAVSEEWRRKHDLTDEMTIKEQNNCVWWSRHFEDKVSLVVCPMVKAMDGGYELVGNRNANRWVAKRLRAISDENSIVIP